MDQKQIIAQVQRETGMKISTADPVLAVAAMNEVIFDQALEKLDRNMKGQADRIVINSAETLKSAEKIAEKLINDAGDWFETRLKAAAEAAAERVIGDIRAERERAERASHIAVRAAWASAAVSGVLVLLVAGYLVAAVVAAPPL